MKKIASIEFIFGGSFDPIHRGHINVIEKLREFCPSWPIRLLPCSVPALKNLTSASFEQRVEMLKIATKAIENIVIDKRENKRDGKSFTLDSLQSLVQEYPKRKFALVVGGDTLNTMNQWHQWQQLSNYCHLLLVNRPGTVISDIQESMAQMGFSCAINVQKLEKTPSGHYYCLNIKEKDVSSTEIRTQLADGLSMNKFIPDCVSDYIKKNRIYAANCKITR